MFKCMICGKEIIKGDCECEGLQYTFKLDKDNDKNAPQT